MTDPALGDVDRILREVREELGAAEESPEEGAEPSWTEAGSGGEEFRDQEYRDAFDESFERAFQEETEPETAEGIFAAQSCPPAQVPGRKTAGSELRKRDPVFSGSSLSQHFNFMRHCVGGKHHAGPCGMALGGRCIGLDKRRKGSHCDHIRYRYHGSNHAEAG